jgi:hypothetical protein
MRQKNKKCANGDLYYIHIFNIIIDHSFLCSVCLLLLLFRSKSPLSKKQIIILTIGWHVGLAKVGDVPPKKVKMSNSIFRRKTKKIEFIFVRNKRRRRRVDLLLLFSEWFLFK